MNRAFISTLLSEYDDNVSVLTGCNYNKFLCV